MANNVDIISDNIAVPLYNLIMYKFKFELQENLYILYHNSFFHILYYYKDYANLIMGQEMIEDEVKINNEID